MLNYIETEVVIRREFRENRELTDKYRRASLTPGEWQNLGQVGDPMGLVAKNEIVVGFSGDVDRMKTIVDKLHKRPFGRVKPGSAQYQRTGLQLVVDWMGYYPDGVSDQRVRYYDSSDTRDAGSRVELLDTKLRGNEVVMTVLKPASREFRGPSDRGPEWSEYEYGMSKDE
ncbi:MAG: hypothetical protein HY381_00680 [Candidatus Chisholmbacteria bacterium]|nr:hypothetical protein [Candidatus Chisholmbacteria bacterium]